MINMTDISDVSKFDLNNFMKSYVNYVYIISGYNEQKLFSVERLNTTDLVWEEMASVNIARTKFGVVNQRNQRFFILGGKLHNNQRTDTVEEYDVLNDTWTVCDFSLPTPRSGFSSCLMKDSE